MGHMSYQYHTKGDCETARSFRAASRKLKRILLCMGGPLFLLLAALPAYSQVTISKTSQLSIGTVVAGVDKIIPVTDPGAGSFTIRLQKPKKGSTPDVSLTFSYLPNFLMGSFDRLKMTYGLTSAAWSYQNDPLGASTFDPARGVSWNPPAEDRIYVWIGGTASPRTNQSTGQYGGTIVVSITVTYR